MTHVMFPNRFRIEMNIEMKSNIVICDKCHIFSLTALEKGNDEARLSCSRRISPSLPGSFSRGSDQTQADRSAREVTAFLRLVFQL